jgi:hypothetical protein
MYIHVFVYIYVYICIFVLLYTNICILFIHNVAGFIKVPEEWYETIKKGTFKGSFPVTVNWHELQKGDEVAALAAHNLLTEELGGMYNVCELLFVLYCVILLNKF